jgi:hypothetical protein
MLRLLYLLMSVFSASSTSPQPQPDQGSMWDPSG